MNKKKKIIFIDIVYDIISILFIGLGIYCLIRLSFSSIINNMSNYVLLLILLCVAGYNLALLTKNDLIQKIKNE